MPPLAFSTSISVRALPPPSRGAICRRRPRACAEPSATTPPASTPPARMPDAPTPAAPTPVAASDDASDAPASYVVVPGKIELNELQLAEQRTKLMKLEAKYKQARLVKEYEASRKFGFVPFAEQLNGRSAAFFFVVGLLTEYWTGYTIPQQIELMLNTVGVF